MQSKSLTAIATGFLLLTVADAEPPGFLGASSCSSSGCHGGAKRGEFIVWSKKDFHSRSHATLTTARSARIAETLRIAAPAAAPRCTICHAPMPEKFRAEGVSCETCHGTGELWLRTHTRPDYTHAERIKAGMRDLKDLSTRANACIACHQNVDADILAAGHPELIFELDGQSVSMPRHWKEASSAAAWLAGQKAALREIAWQLKREPTGKLAAQQAGLEWLLKKCGEGDAGTMLARLAGSSADFEDANVPREIQARRAERLVLALDRLSGDATKPELDDLFRLAQSLPDFEAKKFCAALRRFQGKIQ